MLSAINKIAVLSAPFNTFYLPEKHRKYKKSPSGDLMMFQFSQDAALEGSCLCSL